MLVLIGFQTPFIKEHCSKKYIKAILKFQGNILGLATNVFYYYYCYY